GLGNWVTELQQSPDALGSAIFGTLRGAVKCDDLRKAPILEVRDSRGHFTAQRLEIDMRCKPLVQTVDGVHTFEVDEGQRVDVPLLTGANVTLAKDETVIGEIRGDRFVWEANCSRGRGPFTVAITGRHDELYGDPLELQI